MLLLLPIAGFGQQNFEGTVLYKIQNEDTYVALQTKGDKLKVSKIEANEKGIPTDTVRVAYISCCNRMMVERRGDSNFEQKAIPVGANKFFAPTGNKKTILNQTCSGYLMIDSTNDENEPMEFWFADSLVFNISADCVLPVDQNFIFIGPQMRFLMGATKPKREEEEIGRDIFLATGITPEALPDALFAAPAVQPKKKIKGFVPPRIVPKTKPVKKKRRS